MNVSDVIIIIEVLIGLIAAAIMLISLISYRKFRNWRLLFLGVAFLLISIWPISGPFLTYVFPNLATGWSILEYSYLNAFYSITLIIAFAILTYIYYNEIITQSIKIGKIQWFFAVLLILAELVFVYCYVSPLVYQLGYVQDGEIRNLLVLAILQYLFAGVSYILNILIIISLFSYFRAKHTNNTLVVMLGFIFLLFSQAYSLFGYLLISISGDYSQEMLAVLSFELVGFLAFMIALLRVRVFR